MDGGDVFMENHDVVSSRTVFMAIDAEAEAARHTQNVKVAEGLDSLWLTR